MRFAKNLRQALKIAAAFSPLLGHQASAQTAPRLILNNVTIVDTVTGVLHPHRAIAIEGGKIVRIAAAGQIKGPGRRVDGTGTYAVPGFLDMHAHPLNTSSPDTSLPLMLANGITGFRQMAGAPELLAARAAGTLPLPAVSPSLLAMPGALLAGGPGMTPAEVIAQVRKQKGEGADFIKVIDVGPEAFLAAEDEAKAQGLPIAGHLPPTLDAREAVRHGIASIEHLGPMISELLSCSSQEAQIRQTIAHAPATPRISFDQSPAVVKRLTANPLLLLPPPAFAGFARVVATFDEDKCRAFARDMAASNTWQVPTLVRLQAMDLGNAEAFRTNPDNAYVPASTRALWLDVGKDFDTKVSPANQALLRQLFALQMKLAGMFDAAGVKMMTGTDFGGQWLAPGFSLHHEFDLLAKAGISPLHVLQMTTLNGARFLGREASMGSIDVGKNADLVLLDGDPIASVQNLHRLHAVLHAGTFYSHRDLDDIREKALTTLPGKQQMASIAPDNIDTD